MKTKTDNLLNKSLLIKQVKSGSNLNRKQVSSLLGLGLNGIGSSKIINHCDPSILGMVKKVFHILKISLI
jgi:ribosomal protein L30/L7E